MPRVMNKGMGAASDSSSYPTLSKLKRKRIIRKKNKIQAASAQTAYFSLRKFCAMNSRLFCYNS
jgi:DNA-binding PadR family transcriptional regulator